MVFAQISLRFGRIEAFSHSNLVKKYSSSPELIGFVSARLKQFCIPTYCEGQKRSSHVFRFVFSQNFLPYSVNNRVATNYERGGHSSPAEIRQNTYKPGKNL